MKKIKPQNIYDNPKFLAGYKNLREKNNFTNDLLEQPALRSLLPDLTGLSILDLGCGFGDFARYTSQAGAKNVLGIDVSKKMLEEAKQKTNASNIKFKECAIEFLDLPTNAFDIIVSSYTLHYIGDYTDVINNVHNWLKPKGYFVFSVEHPICTANPSGDDSHYENDPPFWPIYNYRDEKKFTQTWFVENVQKYHRTIQTYVNVLSENGFQIKKLLETMPSDELIAQRPELSKHKIRPFQLIISSQTN